MQSRLKFLDECGVNQAMTRLYGRATKDVRVVESVPRKLWARNDEIVSLINLAGVQATLMRLKDYLIQLTLTVITSNYLRERLMWATSLC